MTWTKLDDSFLENRKIRLLKDKAFRVHVSGLVYCSRNLTDGHLDATHVRVIQALLNFQVKRHVAELVDVELWIPDGVGGYSIKDYLEYNPSAATVKDERRKARVRMQNVRANKAASATEKF